MTGLERSRELFEERVLPEIRTEVPDVLPFLSAGLVGEGSECFGFDDAISLDHDAGTRLCLWLSKPHYDSYEGALRRILDSSGVLQEGFRSGIYETGAFYAHLTGFPGSPETNRDWMKTEETQLAAAVNGEVFLDAPGTFTAIRRKLLSHYPEDVFRFKLAQAVGIAAQTGQYNYPRAVRRKDALTAAMIRASFFEYLVRAVFLLNRTYRPFYKWTYCALSALPQLGKEIRERGEALLSAPLEEAEAKIEAMSRMLIEELQRQQLTKQRSDFLLDHLPDLLSKIEDRSLLEKGVPFIL